MNWFGPSDDTCGCCNCWVCDLPSGISVSSPASGVCPDCENVNATYLLTEATQSSDYISPAVDCAWTWPQVEEACFDPWVSGDYTGDYLNRGFTLGLDESGGNPRARVGFSSRYFSFIIHDTGSATGDPRLIDWDWLSFFVTNPQTIDGWELTGNNFSTRTPFYTKIFTTGCPVSNTVLPHQIGTGGSTQGGCTNTGLTVTLLV